MVLFIDTANLEEIKEVSTWSYVKGVTTNPSLIAKEGLSQKEIISQIVKLIDGPISAEVTAEDYEGMVKQGEELFAIDPSHIVIKLPMTNEGLKACKYFRFSSVCPLNKIKSALLLLKISVVISNRFFHVQETSKATN